MSGHSEPVELFVSKQNIARYRRLADANTSDVERTELLLLLRKERKQLKEWESNSHDVGLPK